MLVGDDPQARHSFTETVEKQMEFLVVGRPRLELPTGEDLAPENRLLAGRAEIDLKHPPVRVGGCARLALERLALADTRFPEEDQALPPGDRRERPLVDPDPLQPGEQIDLAPSLGADTLADPSTVRHATRINCATAVSEQCMASLAVWSSNARVNREPWRAHGTVQTTTPCRRHLTRGASASTNASVGAEIQRPPAPAALAQVRPGRPATADAAAITLAPRRPNRHHDLARIAHPHILDHRSAQPKQPRPYPDTAHVDSGSSRFQS